MRKSNSTSFDYIEMFRIVTCSIRIMLWGMWRSWDTPIKQWNQFFFEKSVLDFWHQMLLLPFILPVKGWISIDTCSVHLHLYHLSSKVQFFHVFLILYWVSEYFCQLYWFKENRYVKVLSSPFSLKQSKNWYDRFKISLS